MKPAKLASPDHIRSGSAAKPKSAKREKSVSPRHVSSTPSMGAVSDIESLTLKISASPVHDSAVRHRKSTNSGRVARSPSAQTSTDEEFQTPTAKPTSSISSGRVRRSSAAKRQKSASPHHVRSARGIQTSTDAEFQTPQTATPVVSHRVASDSDAKRQISASPRRSADFVVASPPGLSSPAHDANTAVTWTTTADASARRSRGSITKHHKSPSPGHADIAASEASTDNTSISVSFQPTPSTSTMTPLLSSHKLSTKRGVKRSGGSLEEPPRKQLGVSFGPDMSPELFDHRLPPITPVKRGATPQQISMSSSALKPLLKGRQSVGTTVAEETESTTVSPKVTKSPKHRAKSTGPGLVTLDSNVTTATASAARRSVPGTSIAADDDSARVLVDFTTTPKSAKRRSKSVKHNLKVSEAYVKETSPTPQKFVTKGRRSSAGILAAEETEDVEPDKSPKSAKRCVQSAERSSDTLAKKDSKMGKKRSKSLSAIEDQEPDIQGKRKKGTSVKRSRSIIGSTDEMAGGENLESEQSKNLLAAAGRDQSSTASPDRAVKRTPQKPVRYRSPTHETGSTKIAVQSLVLARSRSPVKVVAAAHYQPTTTSPERLSKRTPQKPFRYRSPTLEAGSIKVKGSKQIAVAKRARSLSLEIPASKIIDSGISMKAKPASSKRDISPQIMHSTPAVAIAVSPKTLSGSKQLTNVSVMSKDMTTPMSAKKRISLTGSGKKSSKKVNSPVSPRPVLGEISSFSASGKKQKSGGDGKREKSSEGTTLARAITPGRMVAMRAVFGHTMTPKLKIATNDVSFKFSSSPTASSAKKREMATVKPGSGQKSATQLNKAKVASLKKSAGKSTAKKTLWSEVVRRTATTQKSAPKIIKPVIRMTQKTAAVMVVVSMVCCYSSCHTLVSTCHNSVNYDPSISAASSF